MSRKKKEVPGALKEYTVFEQRYPKKKESRYGEAVYEAHLVEVGRIKATYPGEALELAKSQKLCVAPVIWGPDTEAKRDKYKQKQRYDED